MSKPDPYGIQEFGRQFMRDYEVRLFAILVELGVLDDGMIAPWYKIEDEPDWYQRRERPELKIDEAWEDQAPPPASLTPRLPQQRTRDLILD